MNTTRRAFLTHVGEGMLLASLGTALTGDLGVKGAESPEKGTF